jgi:hypothetical protein
MTQNLKWYTSSSGAIELQIDWFDAKGCTHPGPCDADVKAVSELPYIAEQLRGIDAKDLRTELKEYGAWDEEELVDHQQNLQRIVWLACGDIVDNEEE